MKKIGFGDGSDEGYADSIEGIVVNDVISSRTVNRPIINLFNNQDVLGKIINSIVQYNPNYRGIVPGAYSEFNGNSLKAFKITDSSQNQWYIRIPTGIILTDKGIIDNSPNIEFAERRYAKLLNFDLNDRYNDIKILEKDNKYKMALKLNNDGILNLDDEILEIKQIPDDKDNFSNGESNFVESYELFQDFLKKYTSDTIVTKSEVLYQYNVLEKNIPISDEILSSSNLKENDFSIYYSFGKELPTEAISCDLSKKFFLASNESLNLNNDVVKIFTFKILKENNIYKLEQITSSFELFEQKKQTDCTYKDLAVYLSSLSSGYRNVLIDLTNVDLANFKGSDGDNINYKESEFGKIITDNTPENVMLNLTFTLPDNLTDASYMFFNNKKINSVNITADNLTNAEGMFSCCRYLRYAYITADNLTNKNNMFNCCPSLINKPLDKDNYC